MLVYKVTNPRSIANPIPRDIRSGILVYHGTSAVFADSIERHGFDPARLPYAMQDVLTLNEAHQTFGWWGIDAVARGGYLVTGTLTVGSGNAHVANKLLAFSYHYEYARDYACEPGGETLSNLLLAIDDFEPVRA